MRSIVLTDRQREVLRAVVLQHIRSAEPVGSRAVTRHFRMGVSPATVRNVMVDLEEAGLLGQPHTSAGRVPTDRGYRVFVDDLMVPEALTRGEIVLLRAGLAAERQSVETLMDRISQSLARAASQLGIAMAPRIREGPLSSVDTSPVSGDRLLFRFAFASGAVRSVFSKSPRAGRGPGFTEAVNWVNREAEGLCLAELARLLEREIQSEAVPEDRREGLGLLRKAVEALLQSREGESVHFGGAANIMAQPEFNDIERLRPIVAMMERPDLLAQSLPADVEDESVRVVIGRENKWRPMKQCGLVLSSFRSGSACGSVGVIGPTRMPYSKMVPLVERAAELISRSLESMG